MVRSMSSEQRERVPDPKEIRAEQALPTNTIAIRASKIICERAATGPAYDVLLQNVSSPDPQLRSIALLALKYVCKNRKQFHIRDPRIVTTIESDWYILYTAGSFITLVNYPTFHSLVTALENCLKDSNRPDYVKRLPAERHAMWILSTLLPHDVSLALKAGIVKRWLARYPFGRTEAETHEAIRKLRMWLTDDRIMADIVTVLENHPEGRKQMRLAGLTGSSIGESEDDDDRKTGMDDEIVVVRRRRNDTPEERRIRRRRREAIVVSDGRQPLGRGDIIERWGTGPPGDEGSVGRIRRSGEEGLRH